MGRLVNICGLALLLSIAPVMGLSEASPWSRDYEKNALKNKAKRIRLGILSKVKFL